MSTLGRDRDRCRGNINANNDNTSNENDNWNEDHGMARLTALENIMAQVVQIVENQNHRYNPVKRSVISNKISKLKPKTFEGVEDPIILENWINGFNKIFESTDCTNDQKTTHATFYLRETTDHWLTNNRATLEAQPNLGWEGFLVALWAKFYPTHLQRQKYNDFVYLRQRNLIVQEYGKQFEELSRFAPRLVETDPEKMQRFQEGLNDELKFLVISARQTFYSFAYEHACKLYGVNPYRGKQASKGTRQFFWR